MCGTCNRATQIVQHSCHCTIPLPQAQPQSLHHCTSFHYSIYCSIALQSLDKMCVCCCRVKRSNGAVPSSLLYVVFFLPTSINAAWLSVASGLGVLIVPLSYGHTAHLQAVAAVIAVVAIAAGRAFAQTLL